VFPTLGNHDHNPDNGFGPDEPEYLEQIAKIWSQWLPDDALETVRYGGYYWMPVPGVQGLHIVSLNTMYWSATNSLMANVTGDSVDEVSSYMTAIWNNFNKAGDESAWHCEMLKSLNKCKDNRELIPELFTMIEHLYNINYKKGDTLTIDEVYELFNIIGPK